MSDLISRQAAIDATNRADYTGLAVEDVKKVTDEVVKELKQLITFNVLKNATIDETYRTITITKTQPVQAPNLSQFVSEVTDSLSGSVSVNRAPVTCTCPGCGAKVVVTPGQTISCEYCDTPITAN